VQTTSASWEFVREVLAALKNLVSGADDSVLAADAERLVVAAGKLSVNDVAGYIIIAVVVAGVLVVIISFTYLICSGSKTRWFR